jgi:hypothetical protein
MSGCTRTRQLIELAFSGLMKRLVVLGLNMPICRAFCATSLMLAKLVANSWRRMAVRVRAIAVLLVCWMDASLFVLARR